MNKHARKEGIKMDDIDMTPDFDDSITDDAVYTVD